MLPENNSSTDDQMAASCFEYFIRGNRYAGAAMLAMVVLSHLARGQAAAHPGPAAQTLLATAFGARPDDGQDDSPAVRAALAAARKADAPVVLRFAPGRYDFEKATADTAHYPVTAVHLQWDFATPFHLDGVRNLTIEGAGATFMMHGRMTPFVLNACETVTVRGMTIEHEHPSVFELKAEAKNNGTVDYLAADGDRFAIEGKRLVWFDADDQRQEYRVVQSYDPALDVTRRCGDPLKGALSLTTSGKGGLRVRYPAESGSYDAVRVGSSYQFRQPTRNQCGAVIFECQDVTFEDMNIHCWNGLGFVGQFSRDVTLRKLRMEPREGSGRTNAGFSDGIQMMNCRGRLLIEDCRIAGLHDDHINIYGQMMRVEAVETPQVIRAVFTSGETQGYLNFRPGDRIGFRDPRTLANTAEVAVLKAELLDDKTMRLAIQGRLPEQVAGCWVENRTWIPDEVMIRGNYFGRGPTRAILIYLARQAVIENNVFQRIPMASILLQTPDAHYALQNSVGSLAVRNNVFRECSGTLIQSAPQVQTLAPEAGLYRTLEVADNFLSRREHKPLFLDLRGFRGVTVRRNQIESSPPVGKLARFRDCESLELLPQRLVGALDDPQAECLRVGRRKVSGWIARNSLEDLRVNPKLHPPRRVLEHTPD